MNEEKNVLEDVSIHSQGFDGQFLRGAATNALRGMKNVFTDNSLGKFISKNIIIAPIIVSETVLLNAEKREDTLERIYSGIQIRTVKQITLFFKQLERSVTIDDQTDIDNYIKNSNVFNFMNESERVEYIDGINESMRYLRSIDDMEAIVEGNKRINNFLYKMSKSGVLNEYLNEELYLDGAYISTNENQVDEFNNSFKKILSEHDEILEYYKDYIAANVYLNPILERSGKLAKLRWSQTNQNRQFEADRAKAYQDYVNHTKNLHMGSEKTKAWNNYVNKVKNLKNPPKPAPTPPITQQQQQPQKGKKNQKPNKGGGIGTGLPPKANYGSQPIPQKQNDTTVAKSTVKPGWFAKMKNKFTGKGGAAAGQITPKQLNNIADALNKKIALNGGIDGIDSPEITSTTALKGTQKVKSVRVEAGDIKTIGAINSGAPLIMDFTVNVASKNSQNLDIPFTVGIKPIIHVVKTREMIETLEEAVINNKVLFRTVSFFKGELSFLNLILGFDRKNPKLNSILYKYLVAKGRAGSRGNATKLSHHMTGTSTANPYNGIVSGANVGKAFASEVGSASLTGAFGYNRILTIVVDRDDVNSMTNNDRYSKSPLNVNNYNKLMKLIDLIGIKSLIVYDHNSKEVEIGEHGLKVEVLPLTGFGIKSKDDKSLEKLLSKALK